MSVSETCVCGATFNFTAKQSDWSGSSAEQTAINQFRRDHRICRESFAEKNQTEKGTEK